MAGFVRAGLIALLAVPALGLLGTTAKAFVGPTVIAFAGCYLVARCLDGGVGGLIGRLANAAPIQYLGKISYGLYLYHALAAWLVPEVFAQPVSPFDQFMIPIARLALLIAIAACSWHFVEQPFNRRKSRFFMPR